MEPQELAHEIASCCAGPTDTGSLLGPSVENEMADATGDCVRTFRTRATQRLCSLVADFGVNHETVHRVMREVIRQPGKATPLQPLPRRLGPAGASAGETVYLTMS